MAITGFKWLLQGLILTFGENRLARLLWDLREYTSMAYKVF